MTVSSVENSPSWWYIYLGSEHALGISRSETKTLNPIAKNHSVYHSFHLVYLLIQASSAQV